MSTCPDKSFYSAYVDGEVPSPWKEMLEEHLASCEKCSATEKRYRDMRNALQKIGPDESLIDERFASGEFLESSFAKLSARWEIAAEKTVAEQGVACLSRSRKSVTIPYIALAAMLAVAALVPSFFVAKAMAGHASDTALLQAAQNSSSSVIAPSLQRGDPSGYTTAGSGYAGRDFSLINQAKMFAQDKEIFSFPDEGYVIIRLPEMVRFSAVRERRQSEREIFSNMPPERQEEAGYIINAMQRQY